MSTVLYELAMMGMPTDSQIRELEEHLSKGINPFGLTLGSEVAWSTRATRFEPSPRVASAVAFFGAEGVASEGLGEVLRRGIPVLPVASRLDRVSQEIPKALQPFNCLSYESHGPQRVATALLECAGLLALQRRVFVSYRRNESREAALQLFDMLSARHFDVFLDTHDIGPGEDFQAMLWHRLCDCDVLVMLDTSGYFESRWTSAEFGRALAKGISILRVGWPDSKASARVSTASRLDLGTRDIDKVSGRLDDDALNRICVQVEALRSQSQAVRGLSLYSQISQGIEVIGGTVAGVGQHKAVVATLPGGKDVTIYPTVGVPTSLSLHEAVDRAPDSAVAVVYDEVGLHRNWLNHLSWLGTHIQAGKYVKAHEVAWSFADWEV
jgi:hypothetical protein